MKALVLTAKNHLEVQDRPIPTLSDQDILVQVAACGICGSDVHGIDGSTGRRQPPLVMGHEAAGIVAEVGSAVSQFKPGDRVTFDSTVYCGHCHFCKLGLINLCDNRRVLGVSCDDYHRDGAFAEFVSVPQHIVYKLPDSVDFTQAAMIEAISIAVHAVGRAKSEMGATAVVVGTGMIGLLIIQVLRAGGCENIIAVDPDVERLKMAAESGAAITLAGEQNEVAEAARKLTAGRGADVAYEAVGITPAVATAIASLRKGGRIVLVGNVVPTVDMPLQQLVTREITAYGSCASAGEYPTCIEMLAQGKINVSRLISATAGLAEGPQWFERLYRHEPGLLKVILQPDR